MKLGPYEIPGFYTGDVLECLWHLPDESVQMVVTSPPYWRKRGYDGSQVVAWGGDEHCTHDWEWSKRKITSGGGPGKNAQVGATKAGAQRTEIEEAWCRTCNAWAGPLGAEEAVAHYIDHCLLVTAELMRVLKPDGVLWWNVGESYDPKWSNKTIVGVPSLMMVAMRERQGWKIRNEVVWYKRNAMPFSGSDRMTNAHESIIVAVKNKQYKWHKQDGSQDVWDIPLVPWGKHPAIFPPELPRRCIEFASDPGDIVLDPFAGSGTTLAVAACMDRQYLGFDTSETYAQDIFPQRLEYVRDWFAKQGLASV